MLLQLFVGKINAQLLETILLKDFKAENIEYAYHAGGVHGGWAHGIVGALHDPVKLVAVNGFGQSVASIGGLRSRDK